MQELTQNKYRYLSNEEKGQKEKLEENVTRICQKRIKTNKLEDSKKRKKIVTQKNSIIFFFLFSIFLLIFYTMHT